MFSATFPPPTRPCRRTRGPARLAARGLAPTAAVSVHHSVDSGKAVRHDTSPQLRTLHAAAGSTSTTCVEPTCTAYGDVTVN
jgi:RNA 3'-terminal phosphate cyclase